MAGAALEVIVSPFLGVIFDNLNSLIRKEFGLLWGFDKELEKLSDTLSTIRLVLEDAEVKQIKDEATRDWLMRLKEAAYDAEDILGECAFEADRQVSDSFTCIDLKQLSFRSKMGRRVEELRGKFDVIAAERSKFHLTPGVAGSGINEFICDRETSSMLTDPVVYGRDGDRENIVEILLRNASSPHNLSICPILGSGGLGKTTLAQLIYNDERVVEEFDTRIWICVSEDFSLKRLAKIMIECLSTKECNLVDLDPMQNYLKKLLLVKKFLLVLDDVWEYDREKWNKMIYLLTCGSKGSSVIITTRLQTVVDSITSLKTTLDSIACIVSPTHKLKYLSDNDCWSLFKQHAFQNAGNGENQIFLEIGQEIVSKCGGVPLAVKALGGLLHCKREEIWRGVKDSEIWNLQEYGENTILPALRLSYNHLPPLLKQCFAYCSVYPKGYDMFKEDLIHQWMAHDFIRASNRMEVEDIGNEIFNELLRQSFFQESEKIFRRSKAYKMHDLMHDLASFVMSSECSSVKIGEIKDFPLKVRHISKVLEPSYSPATLNTLSLSQSFFRTLIFIRHGSGPISDYLSSFSQPKCLRILHLRHMWKIHSLPPWIGHLKHLRYLNLCNTDIALLPNFICGLRNLQVFVLSFNEKLIKLPPSIGKLKHLRYLDLTRTSISSFPESFCNLTNLQTLKVFECRKLRFLPRNLGNLRSLKYLEIDSDGALLLGMPVGMGQLTCLRTLSVFVVNPSNEYAGIQELERLNDLKGELTIKGLRHIHHPRDAREADLRSKMNLSVLNLLLSRNDEDGDESLQQNNTKHMLEALQPHSNLQKLWIDEYQGVDFPSWVGDPAVLPNLISLSLTNLSNVELHLHTLPSRLKELLIVNCPKLTLPPLLPSCIEELTVERCNDPTLNSLVTLPHLTSLRLGGYDEMGSLPEAPLRNLTCLRALVIRNSLKLTRLPTELENLTTLRSLKIQNCIELVCITQGLQNLTSLEDLSITGCRSLKSLALQHFTALKRLRIDGCPYLTIPNFDFQHLVSLRELYFAMLPQMTSLPDMIQHVITLEVLEICHCKNLKMLPEWLQHQPPALLMFKIKNCHLELHRRCEKDKGEDWDKISRIRFFDNEHSS